MKNCFVKIIAFSATLVLAGSAIAGGHKAELRAAMKDPKLMEAYMDKYLTKTTGIEPRMEEFGAEVVALAKKYNPELGDMDPKIMGHYANLAVRTMNHGGAYEHEYNDALVKLHLTSVSMAKEMNAYDELVEHDVKTTAFMMKRIAPAIKMTGRKDFGLKAVFEQTACFYQLVNDLKWEGNNKVTYTSPFRRVLEASQKVGIFKGLTMDEVHNNYIIPRYMAYADILGIKLEVSQLGENDQITVALVD